MDQAVEVSFSRTKPLLLFGEAHREIAINRFYKSNLHIDLKAINRLTEGVRSPWRVNIHTPSIRPPFSERSALSDIRRQPMNHNNLLDVNDWRAFAL